MANWWQTLAGQGDTLETLVGRDTAVRGNLEFRGAAVVEGRVVGHVRGRLGPEDTLILGPQGVIEGDIRVGTQTLHGHVTGDVYASVLVRLGPSAHVAGNVYYARLEIAEGAEVTGSLVHKADLAVAPRTTAGRLGGQLLGAAVEPEDPDGL